MAKLVLVKHAPPEVIAEVISHRWVLSQEGRKRCGWLAEKLRELRVARLYASLEPKALETAALVAIPLGLNVRPRADLHENDRTGLGFGPAAELRRRIERFFESPSELVIGGETAEAALARFEAAMVGITSEAQDRTCAVITHGTVLSLFVAKYNRIAPFAFWESLALPCCVVLDQPTFRLDGAVHNFPG
jgi:broad specificity phosphatase PhoE